MVQIRMFPALNMILTLLLVKLMSVSSENRSSIAEDEFHSTRESFDSLDFNDLDLPTLPASYGLQTPGGDPSSPAERGLLSPSVYPIQSADDEVCSTAVLNKSAVTLHESAVLWNKSVVKLNKSALKSNESLHGTKSQTAQTPPDSFTSKGNPIRLEAEGPHDRPEPSKDSQSGPHPRPRPPMPSQIEILIASQHPMLHPASAALALGIDALRRDIQARSWKKSAVRSFQRGMATFTRRRRNKSRCA